MVSRDPVLLWSTIIIARWDERSIIQATELFFSRASASWQVLA